MTAKIKNLFQMKVCSLNIVMYTMCSFVSIYIDSTTTTIVDAEITRVTNTTTSESRYNFSL